MARAKRDLLAEFDALLDMPLEEVWSIVTRAWLQRHERPQPWKLVAHQAAFVRRYLLPRPAGAPRRGRAKEA